jgi:Ku protein
MDVSQTEARHEESSRRLSMSDRYATPDVLPATCWVLVAIVGEKQRDHLKLPCLQPVKSRNYLLFALEVCVPASRAFWRGFLKLSFVSCPVALYPATSAAERVSFRQINRRTGHRLRHKLVDSVTGEAVDSSKKARGYEVGEDEFLLVEDRDLERARSRRLPPGAVELAEPLPHESPPTVPAGLLEQDTEENDHDNEEADQTFARPVNSRTIEIERFVQAGQIDGRYFEKPYYVVPREEIGQETFAVIRDAMTREGVVGLARVVLSSCERPFLIEPMDGGLRGMTLRFSNEVRTADHYFGGIPQMKLPAEMMKLAQHIIRTKSTEFDPSMLEDHYRAALVRILRKKQVKRPTHGPPVKPSQENVINLMDALRRSIAAERTTKSSPKRGGAKSSARHPARARGAR